MMKASTSLVISLIATPAPIDTETAAMPEKAEATDTAPAVAVMFEVSVAVSKMSPAWMPLPPSPSMKALTRVATRFATPEPAPLTLTPA